MRIILCLPLLLTGCLFTPDCPVTDTTPRAGVAIDAPVSFDVTGTAMQHDSFTCSGRLVPGSPKNKPGQASLSCTMQGNGQVDLKWSVVELRDIPVGSSSSSGISMDLHSAAATCAGAVQATVALEVTRRTGGSKSQTSSDVTSNYDLQGTYHITVPAQMVGPCQLQAFTFDVPVHLTSSAFSPELGCG